MTSECAVQLIKGGFSFRAGRELGMRSPVWQKGFSDRRITGVDEFERIRNYIHKNPVKQLLVKEAPQYPYSSASRCVWRFPSDMQILKTLQPAHAPSS